MTLSFGDGVQAMPGVISLGVACGYAVSIWALAARRPRRWLAGLLFVVLGVAGIVLGSAPGLTVAVVAAFVAGSVSFASKQVQASALAAYHGRSREGLLATLYAFHPAFQALSLALITSGALLLGWRAAVVMLAGIAPLICGVLLLRWRPAMPAPSHARVRDALAALVADRVARAALAASMTTMLTATPMMMLFASAVAAQGRSPLLPTYMAGGMLLSIPLTARWPLLVRDSALRRLMLGHVPGAAGWLLAVATTTVQGPAGALLWFSGFALVNVSLYTAPLCARSLFLGGPSGTIAMNQSCEALLNAGATAVGAFAASLLWLRFGIAPVALIGVVGMVVSAVLLARAYRARTVAFGDGETEE
jgi:hypothetical protein